MDILSVRTTKRSEFVDITKDIQRVIDRHGVQRGIVVVYSPHTTAGVTVNERADPAVAEDIVITLSKLVPRNGSYQHLEGNADSHVKTSLMGSSLSLIVEEGRLRLGRWQGVFFCEFDGPRSREVWIQVVPLQTSMDLEK